MFKARAVLSVLGGALVFAVALSLFVPADMAGPKALCVTCTQRLDHSLTFGFTALPLSARCVGVYSGALLGVLVLLALGRARATRLPSLSVLAVLLLFLLAFVVDGVNSTLCDVAGVGFYPDGNVWRLATGLGLGLTFALIAYPLIAGALLPRTTGSLSPARNLRDLLPYVLTVAVVEALFLREQAWMAYPAAFLALMGEILTYGMVFALLLSMVPSLRRPMPLAFSSLALGLGTLAAFATVFGGTSPF